MAPSGMTGDQIYDNFYTGTGDDGRGLTASASTVKAVSKAYAERADSIMKLTTRMESSWQGDASGAAQRGAAPLAVEHLLASKEIDQTRDAMSDQVNAFTTAKANVIKVPPTPSKPGFFDNVLSLGGANDSYEAKMAQVNAANDTNLAAMTAYDSQSSSARSGMPDFASNLKDDKAAIGIEEPTPPPPPVGVKPPPNTTKPTRTGQNNPSGTSNPPGTHNQQFVAQNGPHQTGGTDGPGSTETTTTQVTTPGGVPGGTDRPGSFPGGPGRPGFPGGPLGPGGTGGGPGGPFGPGGPGGPFGPAGPFGPGGSGGPGSAGARGFGPGGSGFGPGGSGSGTGGPGGSGAGGAGSGSGSGAGGRGGFGPGAGAAAAEGAAGRGGGGLGGGGRGGAGGMGMGGGRGQGGDDDAEHERPTYLVEPDPHDTFGTDEITAPPVIGE
jgi:hypothetical protein